MLTIIRSFNSSLVFDEKSLNILSLIEVGVLMFELNLNKSDIDVF